MSTSVTIVGMIAGFLTTLCFLPQTIKIIKTNDTRSISLIMYIMFTSGVFLWMIYGFLIYSKPIIIWNAISLPLAVVILYKKYKNMKNKVD